MKFISYLRQQTETWGAIRGDEVVDLGKVLGGSLTDFIASEKFSEAPVSFAVSENTAMRSASTP